MIIQHLRENKYDTLFKKHVSTLSEYEWLEALGIGSYGVTYLIQQRQTKENYVLKRLRIKHKKNANTQSNFQQEIAFLKKNMHTNLPTIKEVGSVNGLPYYIMDYIDGHTFEHLIFKMGMTFSTEESLTIVKQLLEIVMTIHSHGIVHRDLRIPNILLRNHELYIIDFGLACYMKDQIHLDSIRNPKKIENYISDLYCIGHFLLYLLYSNYTPTRKKERCWQEELQLPPSIQTYIERLLLIQPAFPSTLAAYEALNIALRKTEGAV